MKLNSALLLSACVVASILFSLSCGSNPAGETLNPPVSIDIVPDSTSFTVTWSAVPNAQKYAIQLFDDTSTNATPLGNVVYETGLSCVKSGLTKNSDYGIQITPIASGDSATGLASEKLLVSLKCTAPHRLDTTYTGNIVHFEWDSVGGETVKGYQISIGDSNTQELHSITTPQSRLKSADFPMEANTTYKVSIATVNRQEQPGYFREYITIRSR